MKRFFLILTLLMMVAGASRAAYTPRLIYVLEQLRHSRTLVGDDTPMVGGRAVGAAGAPGEFYLLFPHVSEIATDADLSAMLHDASPVVRIMAVKCVLKRQWLQFPRPDIDALLSDKTEIFFADTGCGILRKKVGELVEDLKADPDLLGDPKEPDRAAGGH